MPRISRCILQLMPEVGCLSHWMIYKHCRFGRQTNPQTFSVGRQAASDKPLHSAALCLRTIVLSPNEIGIKSPRPSELGGDENFYFYPLQLCSTFLIFSLSFFYFYPLQLIFRIKKFF